MHAAQAYNAFMTKIQYTIRGISERLDAKIRERAAAEGRSINETVLEALKAGLGVSDRMVRYDDLDDLAGTWVNDPEFDRAIDEMHRVDPELWK
jgi:plasmid stability protein